jgi:hypothetical protein
LVGWVHASELELPEEDQSAATLPPAKARHAQAERPLMPAKGSTGTVRRAPMRADRGVKLYAPTAAKPFFRVVARGQVERTSATVPVALLA